MAVAQPRAIRLSRPELRDISRQALSWSLLLLIMLPTIFIFYWMITLSLKTQVEAMAFPPVFIPTQITFDGYMEVFARSAFVKYTVNSLIIAIGSTGLGLILGVPAAFSIARWRLHRLALVVLVTRMTPGISYLVPWFIMFRSLGLTDTYITLILTHLIVGLPIIIWLMISYFEDLSAELYDASLVDGCSIYGTLWRVALPLVKPGIVVAAILAFIFSWNNFLFAVVLAGPKTRTLPVAVYNIMSYEEIIWNRLAAAAVLITLPVLILTFLIQRHIVSGLTFGAVKG